jgi:excisionase family DNA binding protein
MGGRELVDKLVDKKNSSKDAEALLTPAEVAEMFRVNPKTVTRWARAGKITSLRTLGGHRRFRESEILQLLESGIERTP